MEVEHNDHYQATHGVEVTALVDEPAVAVEAARRRHPHTLVVDADPLPEETLLALVQLDS